MDSESETTGRRRAALPQHRHWQPGSKPRPAAPCPARSPVLLANLKPEPEGGPGQAGQPEFHGACRAAGRLTVSDSCQSESDSEALRPGGCTGSAVTVFPGDLHVLLG
jgi:hypothetical protein